MDEWISANAMFLVLVLGAVKRVELGQFTLGRPSVVVRPQPHQVVKCARPGLVAGAFVANGSGIADDSATFGGYTMGQVVQALQNLGLLAPP